MRKTVRTIIIAVHFVYSIRIGLSNHINWLFHLIKSDIHQYTNRLGCESERLYPSFKNFPTFTFFCPRDPCQRGTTYGLVSVCVCLSQVGVLSKHLADGASFCHGDFLRPHPRYVVKKFIHLE